MVDVDAGRLASAQEAFSEQTGEPAPTESFAFGGDLPDIVDQLAGYLRRGTKRATVGLVQDAEWYGEQPPVVGDVSFVHDRSGAPYAALRTTSLVQQAVGDVTPAFAWDEGEGDRTVESWRGGHERYWKQTLPAVGATFSWDLPAWFQHFSVIWPVPDGARPPVLAQEGDRAVAQVAPRHRSVVARQLPGAGGFPLIAVRRESDETIIGAAAFRPRLDGGIHVEAAEAANEAASRLLMEGVTQLRSVHAKRIETDPFVDPSRRRVTRTRLGDFFRRH